MATSEREVFTFTWRIEHFSFCPQAIGERIGSPVFVVDFLNKSEWMLWIYPRGKQRTKKNFGFFLQRTGDYAEAITFSLALISVTGEEIKCTLENRMIEKNYGCGCSGFCAREDILNIENGFLPNDTLTLKCEMWKAVKETNGDISLNADDDVPDRGITDSDLLRHMGVSVLKDDTLNLRTQYGYNQCTAVTHIEVGNKSLLWPVRRFSEMHPKKKLSICVPTAMRTAPSFILTLYLTDGNAANQNAQIEIQINPDGNKGTYFVKCKIVAFTSTNKNRCVKEDEHLFVPNAENCVWKFPEFIDAKEFKKDNYLDSNQDIVYLRCKFAFTRPEDVFHVEKTYIVPFSSETLFHNCNNSIGQSFKPLYNADKFSDVIIRSGDFEVRAHKMILSAQSAVFNAMFEHDMVEKQSGIVDIKDVEKNILESMLYFMYGDELKITNSVDAEKLYSAADKYEILPLKWLCSCFLKSKLCVSNFCSVLSLADLHHDDDLMDEVMQFIHLHTTEIFYSPTWTEFMKSNHELAAKTMLNMLKNLNL